jgi:CrcB protein
MNYLAVFIGSGLGGISRFAVSAFIGHRIIGNFPWNILSVNLIGAFLIGVISELLALKYSESLNMNYLLIVGFLGGFTTFSAFSLEGTL